jgi:ribosomal protein L32
MTKNGGQGATVSTTAATAPSAGTYGSHPQGQQQQYDAQYQYNVQQQQQYVDPQQYYQAYGSDPTTAQAYGYAYDQQSYDASYTHQQGNGYDYSAYQNQQAYYGNRIRRTALPAAVPRNKGSRRRRRRHLLLRRTIERHVFSKCTQLHKSEDKNKSIHHTG